jgi:hypothetical protein
LLAYLNFGRFPVDFSIGFQHQALAMIGSSGREQQANGELPSSWICLTMKLSDDAG